MKIEDMFNEYLEHIWFTKTEGYYDSERSNIRMVLSFTEEYKYKNVSSINKKFAFSMISFFKARGNCNNAINKKLGVTRRALKYNKIAFESEWFGDLKYYKKHFNCLSMGELKDFFLYLDSLNLKRSLDLTNYCMLNLMYYTGIRRTELVNIRVDQVDLENCCILITRSKNHKARINPFLNELREPLRQYINLDPGRTLLFYDFERGHKLTPDNISAKFRYINRTLGFRHFSPHVLRHTNATVMINNGADLYAVQRLLGHEKFETTEIYARLSKQRVKNVYNSYFPDLR